ncbi:DMT family transporter [Pseudomonas sp. RIT-To-2]|uniref:DMT family transporter n=1 Tax=Pseudomonas sp. RIT-To-2 TaxID=3462541 RepID=UPI002412F362
MNLPISLSGVLLAAAAIAAGAVVPFQAGTNAMLGRGLGHPLWATVMSLVISLMAVSPVMMAMRASAPQWGPATSLPTWAWTGGIAGVLYITAALILAPRMGVTVFMTCVIGGQLMSAVAIDHFGLMGLVERPIGWGKGLGLAIIFVGVMVVQYFNQQGRV